MSNPAAHPEPGSREWVNAAPSGVSLTVRCPACNAAPGVRCLVGRRIAHRIRTASAEQAAGRPLSRRLAATLARWGAR